MIKGLIFDLDGLILDTEFPLYQAWQEIYHQRGSDLPLSEWATCLGTGSDAFDPIQYLERQTGESIDRKGIATLHKTRALELIATEEALPGVRDYLQAAKAMGLRLAVASSSSRSWVAGHLHRMGLIQFFDLICCEEDVQRVKPDPALFRLALSGFGIPAEDAVVFEDSPNGITAANTAGIFCVAVPNRLSMHLPIQHADLVIQSMQSISLADLLVQVEKMKSQQPSPFQLPVQEGFHGN